MTNLIAMLGAFLVGSAIGFVVSRIVHRRTLAECSKSTQLPPAAVDSPATNYRLKALVVCRNPEIIRTFSDLFREICVQVETCESVARALDLLTTEKFEALVLDFDNLPNCAEIAKSVREIRPNQSITIFAIASEEQRKNDAMVAGSSFAIEQPLPTFHVRNLLRTAYGRMLRSSQAYFRFNIELAVSVATEAGPVMQCTTINLSQNGMAINTRRALNRGEKLHLVFALPNSDVVMSAEGIVIWADGHGKAGIQFEGSSASARARYFEWLHDHFFFRFEHQSASAEIQSALLTK